MLSDDHDGLLNSGELDQAHLSFLRRFAEGFKVLERKGVKGLSEKLEVHTVFGEVGEVENVAGRVDGNAFHRGLEPEHLGAVDLNLLRLVGDPQFLVLRMGDAQVFPEEIHVVQVLLRHLREHLALKLYQSEVFVFYEDDFLDVSEIAEQIVHRAD